MGSGYLFPTTFEGEVYSDLTGERLAKELAHLLSDKTLLSRMSANARLFARPDAAARLARSLVAWAEGRAGEEASEPAVEEGN